MKYELVEWKRLIENPLGQFSTAFHNRKCLLRYEDNLAHPSVNYSKEAFSYEIEFCHWHLIDKISLVNCFVGNERRLRNGIYLIHMMALRLYEFQDISN